MNGRAHTADVISLKINNLIEQVRSYAARLREDCSEELQITDIADSINNFSEETWRELGRSAQTNLPKQNSHVFCIGLQHQVIVGGVVRETETLVKFSDLSRYIFSTLFSKLNVLTGLHNLLEETLNNAHLAVNICDFNKLQKYIYNGVDFRNIIMTPRKGRTAPSKTYGATTFLVAFDRSVNELAYDYVFNLYDVRQVFLANVNYLAKTYEDHLYRKNHEGYTGLVDENNDPLKPGYIKKKIAMLDACIQDDIGGQNGHIVFAAVDEITKAIANKANRDAILAHNSWWLNTFFGAVLQTASRDFLVSLDTEVDRLQLHTKRVTAELKRATIKP